MNPVPDPGAADLSVAYIIGTYPLLTTTFIDREIAVLRRLGVSVEVVSLRPPHGPLSSDQTAAASKVRYVLPAPPLRVVLSHLTSFASAPRRYLATLWHVLTAPHPSAKLRAKTLVHFGLAVHVARLVDRSGPYHHVHAHFVDRAALVALVVGRLLGLPYSATAHANDIYVNPVLLREKITEAKFVATCTQANADHLERLVPGTGRIRRLYHGLDVDSFVIARPALSHRPLLLAVGQLKEKKGFAHLVEACRLLSESGRAFRCEIVGEGPLRAELENVISRADLAGTVVLRGALSPEDVKAAYAAAYLFVLPCVTAADGDRDGIPNVILEAMASGLAVVSTDHSGIPEAVEHGSSGLLVAPGDARALADALAKLLDDADMRDRYGEMGRKLVADVFDLEANVGHLLREFAS